MVVSFILVEVKRKMYECNEQKQHQKDYPNKPSLCGHCKMFMHEADACLEDSVIAPIYHKYWKPEDKTRCHFVDDGSKGKPKPIVFIKASVGGKK